MQPLVCTIAEGLANVIFFFFRMCLEEKERIKSDDRAKKRERGKKAPRLNIYSSVRQILILTKIYVNKLASFLATTFHVIKSCVGVDKQVTKM